MIDFFEFIMHVFFFFSKKYETCILKHSYLQGKSKYIGIIFNKRNLRNLLMYFFLFLAAGAFLIYYELTHRENG